MSRRILLTGSTGFVGRQIVRQLRTENVQLRLLVRPESKHKILPSNVSEDEIIISDDIFAESVDWWTAACKGVDTIIHAAWYAEPGEYQNSPKNLDCLIGTLRMAQGAVFAKVRRFVGIGTCAEYAISDQKLTTDSPLNPVSPYAAAKTATFFSLSGHLPQTGVEFAWCRLFYLFGEGEDSRRLVPTIRQSLAQGQIVSLTSGSQIRDFMDVREVGRQIAKVALSSEAGAFNICSGNAVSVRELAESIGKEYGRSDLLKFGARPNNPIDPPFVVGVPSCS